ncbi:facilitated trehalose transporter Tret1-like isoform X1 [Neodiprion virginianus]|uniref:facilitated trehalose transporter Tret1-like n=2 Tax=Neodiprion TaxID=270857 RepID=UPI001ED8C54B|nr:facilitated trehalose transporter Tret1-like [Neodiprion fabricii]XP_046611103.1 facilitated trehalose transporter Tret1-like isoform X1 [Neodiprion virginianus]
MHRYDQEDLAGPYQADVWAVSDRTPLLQGHCSTMGDKIGISQQTLVSNAEFSSNGKKLPQYIAAIAATLGSLAFGAVLGWSTSGGDGGIDLAAEYNITISSSEFSWIGSITNLGAAAVCVPFGVLMDLIGRKPSMLLLVAPFLVGWGLIIWANSVVMFYVGRFILGVSGGAFCVAAPVYTGEISEPSVRGTLGSYFQLMLTIGILFSYTLGAFAPIKTLSIVSAIIPLIFFAVFFFMPESPAYYLMKNKDDLARSSLLRLRGPAYDIEQELQAKKDTIAEEVKNKASFLEAIRTQVARKGLIVAFGLMMFQQLSGVNAIIFYTGSIFGEGGSMSSETSTIIVGVIQVVAVFASTLVVDKLGRKILLISSSTVMTIGAFTVGIYFYLSHTGVDVSAYNWIPLIAVSLFIFMFNLGLGPIPWMMVGELFAPQIKGIAGSSACLFNWIMAFLVTKFYSDLVTAFGNYTTFWIFSVVCALSIVFFVFVVPETKGKTLEQIQQEMGAVPAPPPTSNTIKV